jgi:hypothetical protein
VDDHVRHRERVVRIEGHDPDVPAHRRRRDHDVLARVRTANDPRPGRSSRVDREEAPVDRFERRDDASRHGDPEVVVDEPPERARQVGVPVRQRIERRGVDRRRVEPVADAVVLAAATPVERDPAVLLPDDREVRERAPEHELAKPVEQHRPREGCGRNDRVQRRAPTQLLAVEIHLEARRIDVRDVDEQDAGNPRPVGRVVVEDAGERADPEKPERRGSAAEEHAEVDGSREQPGRGRGLPGRDGDRRAHGVTPTGAIPLRSSGRAPGCRAG